MACSDTSIPDVPEKLGPHTLISPPLPAMYGHFRRARARRIALFQQAATLNVVWRYRGHIKLTEIGLVRSGSPAYGDAMIFQIEMVP